MITFSNPITGKKNNPAPSGASWTPQGWVVCWTRQIRYARSDSIGTWLLRPEDVGKPGHECGKKISDSDFQLFMPEYYRQGGTPVVAGRRINYLGLLFGERRELVYTKEGRIEPQNSKDPEQAFVVEAKKQTMQSCIVRINKHSTLDRVILANMLGIKHQAVVIHDKATGRSSTINPFPEEAYQAVSVAYDHSTVLVVTKNKLAIIDNPLI